MPTQYKDHIKLIKTLYEQLSEEEIDNEDGKRRRERIKKLVFCFKKALEMEKFFLYHNTR